MRTANFLLAVLLALCAAGCQSPAARSGDVRDNGKNLLATTNKADQAYAEGRMLDAEQGYQQVLLSAPGNAHAWMRLGNINLRLDRLEAAVHAYRQCLVFDRNEARCWQNLALSYVQMATSTLEQGVERLDGGDTSTRMDMFRRRLMDSINIEKSEAP